MSEQQKIMGQRVLLVDDQAEVRETVALILGLDGHTVVQASNGHEGLEFFRRERFDLVITDYAMPGMRGDQLATGIRQANAAQPILMITGSLQTFDPATNPVDAVLHKPFALGELRRAVAELVCPVPA